MQLTTIAHQLMNPILNECQTILLIKNAKGTQGKARKNKIDNQIIASNHTIIGTL